jgi:gluconokinase
MTDIDRESSYVMALDVGTSSTRALLFDAAGNAVPDMISQHTYKLTISADGGVTVDADLLVGVVQQTIDEVLQKVGAKAQQIQAVAFDAFWHSLLGIDESGKPVTPVITWEDTRSYRAVHALRKELDEKAVHDRTGVRFHASYWPAKLRWLSEEQPQTYACVKEWISFGEYFHRVILGRSVCSISMASATGLFNQDTMQWDQELIQVLKISAEQLPEVGDVQDALNGLRDEYAKKWPALRDIPWYPAIGDGAAACVGTSCTNEQQWSLTMGTSSAIRVVVSPDQISTLPLGLWLYRVDKKRAIVGGAMSEGGNLLYWLADTFKVPSLMDAEPLITPLKPDEHGLTILPFIAGERSLGWHAETRMTVAGMSTHTTPFHVLRAGMEALAYRLYAIHQELCKALNMHHDDHQLMASGGVLFNSQLLPHIIADTLDTPLYPSRASEASARGAALLALETLGILPDLSTLKSDLMEPIKPDHEAGEIYRRAAARQDALYHTLLPD